MAFAVSGAPLVLPANYGGDQSKQAPFNFRAISKRITEIINSKRQTPAGKFMCAYMRKKILQFREIKITTRLII